jgi:transposase
MPFNQTGRISRAIDAVAGKPFRLADYFSGLLNPIEMAFAKLKALIRKAAARTYDQLWKAVGQVCDLFKEEECYNFFKAAGYETE